MGRYNDLINIKILSSENIEVFATTQLKDNGIGYLESIDDATTTVINRKRTRKGT